MGGTTSKFNDNVWEAADGKLEDPSHTIDGVPPTMEYEVFELQKKAVNQREFDVVDDVKNLMYTTRAVSGTLAWFDVLGPGSLGKYEDLRLRVQVDLARRTWIVYRYDKPLFAGQKASMTVQSTKTDHIYQLFKTACITVSWSRYVAVAARYGPPSISASFTMEDGASRDFGGKVTSASLLDDDDEEDDMMAQAAKIAARRRTASEADLETLHEDGPSEAPIDVTNDIKATDHDDDRKEAKALENTRTASPAGKMIATALNSTCEMCTSSNQKSPPASVHAPDDIDRMMMEKSQGEAASNNADPAATKTNADGSVATPAAKEKAPTAASPGSETPAETSGARVKNYFMSRLPFQRTNTPTNSNGGEGASPVSEKMTPSRRTLFRQQSSQSDYEVQLEGVINLDDDAMPIIKCQEIYNKIIGNHQTSLISKQEMIEMLRMDQEQHDREETGGADSTGSGAKDPAPLADGASEENPLVAAIENEEEKSGGFVATLDGRRIKSAWSSLTSSFRGDEKDAAAVAEAVKEDKETAAPSTDETAKAEDSNTHNRNDKSEGDEKEGDDAKDAPPGEQPLVAYWSWKNTVMVHKMQLHLAKNSDLALHVVLAIIVNQVRYERNAIAMTV